MTKKQIVKSIAEEVGIQSATVLQAVQMVLDGITETLVSEGRIELRNFGVFKVHERRARMGLNPRTGAQVSVPQKRVVSFKPGREMIQEVRRQALAPTAVLPANRT